MIGIYGANGFIGRHLLASLVSEQARVRAVSRSFAPDLLDQFNGKAEILDADLRDPIAMASSLQGVDTVVQLVSTSSPGMQNRHSVADIQENVVPHVEFIQRAIDAGVRRFIFISSGGTVYGPDVATPIQEDAPTTPISSHGLTKLTIEKYLQLFGHVDGLDYVVLRVANPFGPGQIFKKGQGLIPAVLGRYADGLPVKIIGDGGARRDFIFISDVVDAIKLAIRRDEVRQQIINIGSGHARSVAEVIDTMEDILQVKFEREYIGSRKTDVDINVLDIRRAERWLGWRPQIDFRKGLELTLENYAAVSYSLSEKGLR